MDPPNLSTLSTPPGQPLPVSPTVSACGRYRPAAFRGSLLYFVLNSLALVDPMYQFSLDTCAPRFFFFRALFSAPRLRRDLAAALAMPER